MKKSGKVTLGLVASAAMVLLGCQRSDMKRCVDKYGMVTEDFYCDPARPSSYRGFYHWYYGGTGGRGYGTYVSGGSSTPGVGHSSSTGVSRGGFGSHGSAHSAGS